MPEFFCPIVGLFFKRWSDEQGCELGANSGKAVIKGQGEREGISVEFAFPASLGKKREKGKMHPIHCPQASQWEMPLEAYLLYAQKQDLGCQMLKGWEIGLPAYGCGYRDPGLNNYSAGYLPGNFKSN